MLKMAFDRMSEFIYNPSNDQKIITHRLGDIEKKIMSSLGNEQRDMFDEYLEEENISITELARQMIVFGYLLGYQELKEMDALK